MCYKTSKQFFLNLANSVPPTNVDISSECPKQIWRRELPDTEDWFDWRIIKINQTSCFLPDQRMSSCLCARLCTQSLRLVKKATRIGNRIRTNIVRYLQEVPQRRWFSAPSFDALDTPVSSPCRAKRHTMQSSTLKKRNVTNKKPEQQPEQQRRTSIACRIDLFSSTSRPDNNASATSANTRRPSCVPNRTRICEKKRNSI